MLNFCSYEIHLLRPPNLTTRIDMKYYQSIYFILFHSQFNEGAPRGGGDGVTPADHDAERRCGKLPVVFQSAGDAGNAEPGAVCAGTVRGDGTVGRVHTGVHIQYGDVGVQGQGTRTGKIITGYTWSLRFI